MSICFKTFQPTVLLSCEMKQKTCGAGKAIGREKPGLGVKYMMTVVLEMVYYCRIFPEMLFSSRINCILEQGQILCSPPLLLITKVSEEAWGSTHLNIFFFFLLSPSPRWCLSSGPWRLLLPARRWVYLPAQWPSTLFHGLQLKINYTAEVRGKKQRPIHLCQGKWTAPRRSGWKHWQRHLSRGRLQHKHKVRVLLVPKPQRGSPTYTPEPLFGPKAPFFF